MPRFSIDAGQAIGFAVFVVTAIGWWFVGSLPAIDTPYFDHWRLVQLFTIWLPPALGIWTSQIIHERWQRRHLS